MMSNRMKWALALGMTALVGACSTGGERPTPVPTRPPVTVDRGLSPADYVEQAASLDLLMVKSSQLAFTLRAIRGFAIMRG